MKESKFLKAHCKLTGRYFALEVQKFDNVWKVVNFDELNIEDSKIIASEVVQSSFQTNDNLLACSFCGNRSIGGCSCAKSRFYCVQDLKYHLDCAYCDNLEIDYTPPSREIHTGEKVIVQGKEVQSVNFSNVKWIKFDRIQSHINGRLLGFTAEPHIHVIAEDKNIEFHGYNISEMDEGVYYEIGANDDFEIECEIDTSGINPHPGGYLYIEFGLIQAQIKKRGGSFFLNGEHCCNVVGPKFKMRLSLTSDNKYAIYINDLKKGERIYPRMSTIRIYFGFKHGPHRCESLSHAALKNIKMTQGVALI